MRKNEIIKFLPLMIIWAATPLMVSAAVLINEIAWMGTTIAPQDEWLELKNDGGENIDLTGWILTIEGVRDITLDKTIAAGGYYLIERTDDNSVPNITADLISPFGNGLNNSGATLILKNASGAEINKVVGGENWSLVGGDNATKNTAQRTASGWTTATPTPRAINAANSSPGNNPPANEQSTGSSSQSGSQTTNAEKPPEIKVEIVANKTAVVGADTLLSGKTLGADGKPLENVRFLWNFGDGETKEGQNVLHRFRFPGEYIVTLDIAYGKWSAADRLTVTAVKSPLKISRTEEGLAGFVEIVNEGSTELDLFGWYLKSDNIYFLIPKNTIVANGKKIIFPNEITKLAGDKASVLLLYPNGVVAANYEETVPTPTPPPVKPVSSTKSDLVKPTKEEKKEIMATATAATVVVYEAVKTAEVTPKESGLGVWLLALGGLIVVSLGAFLFSKQKATPSDNYEIIE